jgi:hypothetical protein
LEKRTLYVGYRGTSLSEAAIAEVFSFAEVCFGTQAGMMTHVRHNTVSAGGYETPPIALVSDAMATAPAEGTSPVRMAAASIG